MFHFFEKRLAHRNINRPNSVPTGHNEKPEWTAAQTSERLKTDYRDADIIIGTLDEDNPQKKPLEKQLKFLYDEAQKSLNRVNLLFKAGERPDWYQKLVNVFKGHIDRIIRPIATNNIARVFSYIKKSPNVEVGEVGTISVKKGTNRVESLFKPKQLKDGLTITIVGDMPGAKDGTHMMKAVYYNGKFYSELYPNGGVPAIKSDAIFIEPKIMTAGELEKFKASMKTERGENKRLDMEIQADKDMGRRR